MVSDGTAGSLHMSMQQEVWPNLDHEHEVIYLGLFTRKFCVLFPDAKLVKDNPQMLVAVFQHMRKLH